MHVILRFHNLSAGDGIFRYLRLGTPGCSAARYESLKEVKKILIQGNASLKEDSIQGHFGTNFQSLKEDSSWWQCSVRDISPWCGKTPESIHCCGKCGGKTVMKPWSHLILKLLRPNRIYLHTVPCPDIHDPNPHYFPSRHQSKATSPSPSPKNRTSHLVTYHLHLSSFPNFQTGTRWSGYWGRGKVGKICQLLHCNPLNESCWSLWLCQGQDETTDLDIHVFCLYGRPGWYQLGIAGLGKG